MRKKRQNDPEGVQRNILEVATVKPRPTLTPIYGQKATLSDLVTQRFFADGTAQEASGVYHETEHVRVRSLDRVPRPLRALVVGLDDGHVHTRSRTDLRDPRPHQAATDHTHSHGGRT